MKTLILGVIFSSVANSATPLPQALTNIEKKYKTAKTLTTEFEQTTQVAITQTQKVDKGHISFKRPDKMHWQTEDPNPGTLVSDGKTYWVYTPPFDPHERGTVIIKKARDVKSELATQLLSGQFGAIKNLSIKTISPVLFEFTPKAGAAGEVKSFILEIEPKLNLISSVTLHHLNGNVVHLKFENTKLGVALSDSMFHFVPPRGTDTFNE